MAVKSSFEGLHKVTRAMALLEKDHGVTADDVQRSVVNDAVQRRRVAAIIKGEDLPEISIDDLIERENSILLTLCHWMSVDYPGHNEIEDALRKAHSQWGGISVHDRVLPAGLDLAKIFAGFYFFNGVRTRDNEISLKMSNEPNKEWWRTDSDVQHIPTELSVIRQDLACVMQPIDLAGRPFNLNIEEQVVWAKEQGCDSIMSAEEVTYLFLRSVYERNLPLWPAGSCRTCNTYVFTRSLRVYWDAESGFGVEYWNRDNRNRYLGALPRNVLVID